MELLVVWGIILIGYISATFVICASKLNKGWDEEEEENPFNGNN